MKSSKIGFSSLAEKWPSSYVARGKVGEFTGGILNPRTMANLDALGQGCPGRIKVGRKVAYPVDKLIKWLDAKSQITLD